MGAMGRYIAAVGVEGRDRVIGAARINTRGGWYFDPADGCGCLVMVAEDIQERGEGTNLLSRPALIADALGDCPSTDYPIEDKFAEMCYRFGAERIIGLIKARAARLNASDSTSIAALVAASDTTPHLTNSKP